MSDKFTEALRALVREIVREEIAHEMGSLPKLEKALYSETEFCQLTGISRETARRMRLKGKLKFTQIGRRIFYTPEQITEFLRANEKKRRSRTKNRTR